MKQKQPFPRPSGRHARGVPALFAAAFAAVMAGVLFFSCAIPAMAGVGALRAWDAEITRDAAPIQIREAAGETVRLSATITSNGVPAALPDGATAQLLAQTNGMGTAAWVYDAAVTGATVSAAIQMPAVRTRFWLMTKAPGGAATSLKPWGELLPSASPGVAPNQLAPPVQTIDFAQIQIANAPWPDWDDLQAATNAAAAASAALTRGATNALSASLRAWTAAGFTPLVGGASTAPKFQTSATDYQAAYFDAAGFSAYGGNPGTRRIISGYGVQSSGGDTVFWKGSSAGGVPYTPFFADSRDIIAATNGLTNEAQARAIAQNVAESLLTTEYAGLVPFGAATIADRDSIPAASLAAGDVCDVLDDGTGAFAVFAWDGSAWQPYTPQDYEAGAYFHITAVYGVWRGITYAGNASATITKNASGGWDVQVYTADQVAPPDGATIDTDAFGRLRVRPSGVGAAQLANGAVAHSKLGADVETWVEAATNSLWSRFAPAQIFANKTPGEIALRIIADGAEIDIGSPPSMLPDIYRSNGVSFFRIADERDTTAATNALAAAIARTLLGSFTAEAAVAAIENHPTLAAATRITFDCSRGAAQAMALLDSVEASGGAVNESFIGITFTPPIISVQSIPRAQIAVRITGLDALYARLAAAGATGRFMFVFSWTNSGGSNTAKTLLTTNSRANIDIAGVPVYSPLPNGYTLSAQGQGYQWQTRLLSVFPALPGGALLIYPHEANALTGNSTGASW